MNVLRRGFSIVGLMAVSLLLGGIALAEEKAGEGRDQESKDALTIERLPAAVQKTAREQAMGAVIRAIAKEVEAGKTVYEIEMTANGRGKDILIAADGALMLVETEVALDSLPAAVRATITGNVGKGKILLVESVAQSDTIAYYEAQVRTGSKTSEIKVHPNGRLILEPKKK